MRKQIILALALLFGAKAFAQEWEYIYQYDKSSDSIVNRCREAYGLQDGRLLVSGMSHTRNGCGILIGTHTGYDAFVLALDSDGTELCRATYHKDGYMGCSPYVLENSRGETFILHQYNPDHDTCSANYFRNFDPPTDHSILALYRLNDDLSVAESFEWNIHIDTTEFNHSSSVNYGHISLFSAMVDSEGYIVGGYKKTVSTSPFPIAMDSTIFFKMDFEGHVVKRKGYVTADTGSYPEAYYRYYHLVEADTLYLYYGWKEQIVDGDDNLIYLDKDFNVVRTRRYRHSAQIPGIHPIDKEWFYDQNVVRSAYGTTYMSTLVYTDGSKDDGSRNNLPCCVLYEFDDNVNNSGHVVPIKRFAKRSTGFWDFVPIRKGVALAGDNSVYFAYSMNVGSIGQWNSWVMIDHLLQGFELVNDVYYDLPGKRMHTEATNINVTEDGGVLLLVEGYDMERSNVRYEAVVKFPAEAFLGVEEAHANGLKVAIAYPNPGHDVLNIRTSLPDARVEVYDTNGRLVHSQGIMENVTEVDASSWPADVYVWQVFSGGKVAESGKWVKE